jgi:hypothetical protein
VQSLLTAVLQSDLNGDMILSEEEMEELLLRLQTFSSLPMDTERLRDEFRMSSTHSTTTLFRLTSNHTAGDRTLDDLEDDDNLGTYFKCLD